MKISDIEFVPGCSCCQTYDVAEFETGSTSIKVMRVPQEEGDVRYIVIINLDGNFDRYFKQSEEQANEILGRFP